MALSLSFRVCMCVAGLALACAAGCDLFTPRTPEAPGQEAGTWLQPDTPERVAENLQAALAELNTQNYLRSLSESLEFVPAVPAQTREGLLWSNWGRAEEETYFRRLQAAGAPFSGHSLQLVDVTRTVLGDDRYALDATYLLTVRHSRIDEGVPVEVQGHLVWEIARGEDGLWRLARWTDHALGNTPSWSDLKAAFVR